MRSAHGFRSVYNLARALRWRAMRGFGLCVAAALVLLASQPVGAAIPSDIRLNPATVTENNAVDDPVGTLTAIPGAAGDTHTFTLVNGTGAEDNASFYIDVDTLRANAVFDYEERSTFSIRVRATAQDELYLDKVFTITIEDVNEPPVLDALNSVAVDEHTAAGIVITTVTATDPENDELTFSLTGGHTVVVEGITDPVPVFAIDAATGAITVASSDLLDYETNPVFELQVQVKETTEPLNLDTGTLEVNLNDVSPTAIQLSNASIAENNALNAIIGTFTAVPALLAGTYTFELVEGSGDDDNASFNIDGQNLRADVALNYELKSTLSIRVRATNLLSDFREDVFTITVLNVIETQPTIVVGQSLSVAENSVPPTVVGTVVATDPDEADALTYEITDAIDPAGLHDMQGVFVIDPASGQVTIANLSADILGPILDYEGRVDPLTQFLFPYQIEVRVTDLDALTDTQVVTINLTDVNEPPVLASGSVTVDEHTSGTIFQVTASDPESGEAGQESGRLTFTLTGGHTVMVGGVAQPVFAIGVHSGDVTVLRPDLLDHETTPSFILQLQVTDDADPANQDTGTLQVSLNDVGPSVLTRSIKVPFNGVEGRNVGTVRVSNPDGGAVSFSVTGFTINGASHGTASDYFNVDADGNVTLGEDAPIIFAGVDPIGDPQIRLTLQVTATVTGDSTDATLDVQLQVYPGGSPVMVNVGEDVTAGSGDNLGDPVQDIAAGPNGELISVGSMGDQGYLKIVPRDFGEIHIVELPAGFVPSGVAANDEAVYVAGTTSGNQINWKARLIGGAGKDVSEPPLQLPAKPASVRQYSLSGAFVRSTYPFGGSYDSMITDMIVADGALFVCGARRSTKIGDYDPWPRTYRPCWAKLSSALGVIHGQSLSPNKPGDLSNGNFTWGDGNEYRQYGAFYTAIAVSPVGDVYLGGYNLSWTTREAGIQFANGWIARMKRRSDTAYGDGSDTAGTYETWIADEGNQGRKEFTTNPVLAVLNCTFIKDLLFVQAGGKSTLYALEEYRGKGLPFPNMYWRGVRQTGPGYDDELASRDLTGGEKSLEVKIARFNPDLKSDTGSASAYIRISGPQPTEVSGPNLIPRDVRVGSLAADLAGNIYVTGLAPAEHTIALGTETLIPDRDRLFVARYKGDLGFEWVRMLEEGDYAPIQRRWPQFYKSDTSPLVYTTAPGSPVMGPLLAEWHPAWGAILLGGSFLGGEVILREGDQVNSVEAPSDDAKNGFLTLIGGNSKFIGSSGLVIESIAETDGRPVGSQALIRPFLGARVSQAGAVVTVEAPKVIYAKEVDGIEVYLGTIDTPPTEEVIKAEATTRYVNTGISVGNKQFHSDANTYTLVFEDDTTVTIHWRPEHAVMIESDLTGTGASFNDGGWQKNDDGLGLTSTAAGNPQPPVDKHWVAENELFTAFINGTETDIATLGTRYAVSGFEALGFARTDGGSTELDATPQSVAFDAVQPRHQVEPFVVRGPAKITYQWKIQHRIQVSTSSSRSQSLPGIHVTDGSAQLDFFGSGEAWYDRGTTLIIGARDESASPSLQQLAGWLNSMGQFREPTSAPNGRFEGLLGGSGNQFSVGGSTYLGYGIGSPGLQESTMVLWNYGDTIFETVVTLGNAATYPGSFPEASIKTSNGNFRPPDQVRLVSSPPGSTATDVHVWDAVARLSYPLQPAVFLLEWNQPNSDAKVVLQITSGFGGDRVYPQDPSSTEVFGTPIRHYRHLSHPDMPAVALDPDPEDAYAFLGLKYTESDGQAPADSFTAQIPGRHVLLFSRSTDQTVPASGDLSREPLLVRVAETRPWDAVYDDSDPDRILKGAWGAPSSPMLIPGQPATIGQKVTSSYDTADLETGFVVHPKARYNARIYSRGSIPDAGPIIPVNRHFTGDSTDDLVIVWYERSLENVLWPYQSVQYVADWPTQSYLTVVEDPPGTPVPQPLDRIVVASRLGSEGRNESYIDQTGFEPERYSQVRIYHQPNRELPGYNPNEEHALIAPSFKFLDRPTPPVAAFALRRDLNITTADAGYTSDPYVLVEYFDRESGEDGEFKMAVYSVELEDDRPALNPQLYPEADPDLENPNDQREFPYMFSYPMKAGEPVQPPYPLGLVIGLTPCAQTSGRDVTYGRTYWEDHTGQPWAVSEGMMKTDFYYPLLTEFWQGEGVNTVVPGSCVAFSTAGDVFVTGTVPDPAFSAGSAFQINNVTITLSGSDTQAFIDAVNSAGFVATQLSAGEVRIQSLGGEEMTLVDGNGSPLGAAGISGGSYAQTDGVTFAATWPDVLPILKVGETLTFAGGEYKADHSDPEQPGLPGVVGWAVGNVIFDSLNPALNNQWAFDTYSARLISPLEDRVVQLTDSQAQELEDIIQPASGITRVVGTLWKFEDLPASLGKRLYYDPFNDRLIFRGFLNDKTLGDSTLTATPPPVYVLEPNVLTARERERLLLFEPLRDQAVWTAAVDELYARTRNPNQLSKTVLEPGELDDNYYIGLELDVEQENNSDKLDENGDPITKPFTARPRQTLGPGLALVPSPHLLEPGDPDETLYVTLSENDDPEIGGPVAVHIVKIVKRHRYRGAIKTILSDNVFDEKITLRHTADFGGNGDPIVYQWFYREENGQGAPLPPDNAWRLFPDHSNNDIKGLGLYQITLQGSGGLILSDNLFFLRYRHQLDVPADGNPNSVDWVTGSTEKPYGTEWNRDGADFRDPLHRDAQGEIDDSLQFGGEWAGAANSPTLDRVYRSQLVMGWIKRVLDRVNPYEARFTDFRNEDEAPATYANMILEAGQRAEGPVALNPDKNVIENVGLIELYQTILDRGIALSIGLSSPIANPGVQNALLLAATRISELYTLLANEAYTDALDPTIGFGSSSVEYGDMAPALFTFQNQVGSLLDEELSLLRGVDDSYGRPVYNRLFWNLTKGEGEVAYAMNYNLKDINQDGFIDEGDAQLLYPQGHGDAWGHCLTALKTRYQLLRHPFFNWQTRSEFYNLLDVVVPVDYYDERKFAETAAIKAQVGAEIVNLTYRSRYVDDPDGQWQGYTDPIPDRDWGVAEWARRAGQGAFFDWVTANALLPSCDPDPTHEGVRRVDRRTVSDIPTIGANLGAIQNSYDDANAGMNPLGLDSDVVPFDIDPTFAAGFIDIGPTTHFEQIVERAVAALGNAAAAFDAASARKVALRNIADSVDEFRLDVMAQDREYRNRLIEIFGAPYEGTIGTGKPYPAGYQGPDLSLFMYVDVRNISKDTVPPPSETYAARLSAFANDLSNDTEFNNVIHDEFLDDLESNLISWTGVVLSDNSILELNLPATAADYAFQAPPEWGTRSAPGRLQQIISEMVQAEADLALAVGDYDVLISNIEAQANLLEAKYNVKDQIVQIKTRTRNIQIVLNALIQTLKITSASTLFTAEITKNIAEATSEGLPKIIGLSNDTFFGGRMALSTYGATAQYILRITSLITSLAAEIATAGKEHATMNAEISIAKEEYEHELQEMIKDLEALLINEGTTRITVFRVKEQLRSLADQYRAALSEGVRLIEERKTFNEKTAAAAQSHRYQDMAFRVSRNALLQKYRAAFDLAARYTYLSAKAYDFETNLSPNDRGSAQPVLNEIVRTRTLGQMADGEPLRTGGGLAGILGTLGDNFAVLEGQFGLNNPQFEWNTFSLRQELFGIGYLPDEVNVWRAQLRSCEWANLWDNPEFRRFCRPFAPRNSQVPEPGLIIPFGTDITAGRNFFGNPLQPGHSAYDPTHFATRIRSVAVEFVDYDTAALSQTPRVYLIPAGMDIMYIPTSETLETRVWNVVDQRIPVPFKTSAAQLQDPDWIAIIDGLDGPLGEIRRFAAFRAGSDGTGDLVYDTRLVCRSVWNTHWLLVVPARLLLSDPQTGLDTFINTVTDITLSFETYGASGN